MLVGESFRADGGDFDTDARLDPREYAAHGGVVPIRVGGGAVIGAVGVSGLPQQDDHDLVVEHLRAYLAEQREADPVAGRCAPGAAESSADRRREWRNFRRARRLSAGRGRRVARVPARA